MEERGSPRGCAAPVGRGRGGGRGAALTGAWRSGAAVLPLGERRHCRLRAPPVAGAGLGRCYARNAGPGPPRPAPPAPPPPRPPSAARGSSARPAAISGRDGRCQRGAGGWRGVGAAAAARGGLEALPASCPPA